MKVDEVRGSCQDGDGRRRRAKDLDPKKVISNLLHYERILLPRATLKKISPGLAMTVWLEMKKT